MTAMDSAKDSFTVVKLAITRRLAGTSTEEQDRIASDAQKQWQPAYDRLDAAVSNAELVSSRQVIGISKALLKAYFLDYYRLVFPGLPGIGTGFFQGPKGPLNFHQN